MERLQKLPIAIRDNETGKVVRIAAIPDPRECIIAEWRDEGNTAEPVDPRDVVRINADDEVVKIRFSGLDAHVSQRVELSNRLEKECDWNLQSNGLPPIQSRVVTIADYKAGNLDLAALLEPQQPPSNPPEPCAKCEGDDVTAVVVITTSPDNKHRVVDVCTSERGEQVAAELRNGLEEGIRRTWRFGAVLCRSVPPASFSRNGKTRRKQRVFRSGQGQGRTADTRIFRH